jgi:hypothetical protein
MSDSNSLPRLPPRDTNGQKLVGYFPYLPPRDANIQKIIDDFVVARCKTFPRSLCTCECGKPHECLDGRSNSLTKFYDYFSKVSSNPQKEMPSWPEVKGTFEQLAIAECLSEGTIIFKNTKELDCRQRWMNFYQRTYNHETSRDN